MQAADTSEQALAGLRPHHVTMSRMSTGNGESHKSPSSAVGGSDPASQSSFCEVEPPFLREAEFKQGVLAKLKNRLARSFQQDNG